MRLWDFSFSISQPFCGEHMLTVITNKQQSPRLRGVHQKLGWMVSSLLTSPTWSSCFPLFCQRAFSSTRESAQPVCVCKSWPQGQSPPDRGWESVNISTPYLVVGQFWQRTSECSAPNCPEQDLLINTPCTGFLPFLVSPSPGSQLCFLGSIPKYSGRV